MSKKNDVYAFGITLLDIIDSIRMFNPPSHIIPQQFSRGKMRERRKREMLARCNSCTLDK
jgi:hypothetical protein